MRLTASILIIFILSTGLHSQHSAIPFLSLPVPDVTELLKDNTQTSGLKPFVFAKNIEVSVTPDKYGQWNRFGGDTLAWRLGITIQGAYSLNLLFGHFLPAQGAEIFVCSTTGKVLHGPYTTSNSSSTGALHIPPLPGDSLIIELLLTSGSETGMIELTQVGYGFRDIFGSRRKDSRYNTSGACNIDINCHTSWRDIQNAVVRLMYVDKLVTSYCTGTLINNTRFDGTPYILTANHCIHTQAVAGTTVAVFGYEKPSCQGGDGSTSNSISGAVVVATSSKVDFTLLRMDDKPPLSFQPYYAGWNRSSANPPWGLCIHHPSGDVKKLSIDYDVIYNGNDPYLGYDSYSYWKIVQWDIGVTENGSSGAALFDPDHLIVGSLTGGTSACGYPYEDYFTQFSLSYNKYASLPSTHLKPWLDPIQSNVYKLGGYNPAISICDTLSNIFSNDTLSLSSSAVWGYLTGHNDRNDSIFAEKMFSSTPKVLRGILAHIGKAYNGTYSSTITLKIWTGDSLPVEQIYSKDILLRNIHAPGTIYHPLDTFIVINSNCFIGYKINYSAGDTFAVMHVKNRLTDTLNTAYIKTGNIWQSFEAYHGIHTSLNLDAVFCDTTFMGTDGIVPDKKSNTLLVYPNPASESFTLDLGRFSGTPWNIRLYRPDGVCVYMKTTGPTDKTTLYTTELPAGFYLIHLQTGYQTFIAKIIIRGR